MLNIYYSVLEVIQRLLFCNARLFLFILKIINIPYFISSSICSQHWTTCAANALFSLRLITLNKQEICVTNKHIFVKNTQPRLLVHKNQSFNMNLN